MVDQIIQIHFYLFSSFLNYKRIRKCLFQNKSYTLYQFTIRKKLEQKEEEKQKTFLEDPNLFSLQLWHKTYIFQNRFSYREIQINNIKRSLIPLMKKSPTPRC